jgi:hypothetical protein
LPIHKHACVAGLAARLYVSSILSRRGGNGYQTQRHWKNQPANATRPNSGTLLMKLILHGDLFNS